MMFLRWADEHETVMFGRCGATIDEQLVTRDGLATCTIAFVERAWYTGAFLTLLDPLYGPCAPIDGAFPHLRLWVDGVLQDGSTLPILGDHQLWTQGDPVFVRNVFFHIPRFYELKTSTHDLWLQTGPLIYKHRAALPWAAQGGS